MIERTSTRPGRRRAAGLAAIGALALLGSVGVAPTATAGGPLERDCEALDRSRKTSCELGRGLEGEWVLTTRLVIGSGAKARLTSVERRFCKAMRSSGQSARVTRWNALPGQDRAAKLQWSCDRAPTPSVSSPPPTSMPRYGGAYLRYR
jgi:hypothetical protein